jgi:uncharacterized membrane protein (DUF485 family)
MIFALKLLVAFWILQAIWIILAYIQYKKRETD